MITALPSPPSTNDPANFANKADALLAALPTFVTEANATAVAMNLNSTTDTSASSIAIGTGAKTFTVSTGKSFQPGMYLVIADTAAPSTNSMFGQITSYDAATGALVMSIATVKGSGTKTAWTISQSSAGGAAAGANSDITSLTAMTASTAEVQTGTSTTKVPSVDSLRNGLTVVEAAQATTSGTFKDSGAIPDWATEISINVVSTSTNGQSPYAIQLIDAGGVESPGYLSIGGDLVGAAALVNTLKFIIGQGVSATGIVHGHLTLKRAETTTNTWTLTGMLGRSDSGQIYFATGSKATSQALTGVRFTTLNGTDTFDSAAGGFVSFSYR